MSEKLTIAQELNNSVATVIGQTAMQGFERAYLIAEATQKLQTLLTPQYMKPIMALQGNRLGFKTDKVYNENEVKNCLIEAVLTGLQPHGNQFNIIAGNMYPTKEGLGYLLANYKGLSYTIKSQLPRINSTSTSAAIVMDIKWSIAGGTQQKEAIEIPIKMNKFMGTDAVIGKATRKARAWLYSTITGSEISEGDVTDLDSQAYLHTNLVTDADKISEEKEYNRILSHIENSKTLKELEQVEEFLVDEEHQKQFDIQKENLILK